MSSFVELVQIETREVYLCLWRILDTDSSELCPLFVDLAAGVQGGGQVVDMGIAMQDQIGILSFHLQGVIILGWIVRTVGAIGFPDPKLCIGHRDMGVEGPGFIIASQQGQYVSQPDEGRMAHMNGYPGEIAVIPVKTMWICDKCPVTFHDQGIACQPAMDLAGKFFLYFQIKTIGRDEGNIDIAFHDKYGRRCPVIRAGPSFLRHPGVENMTMSQLRIQRKMDPEENSQHGKRKDQ